MKRFLVAFAAALIGIGLAWQSAAADGVLKHHRSAPPACEPGYKMVEEITYQDVVRTVCRMVPEVQKKWVYSTIPDPYCVRDSKHGECPNCAGPYCRQLLVKTQIELPCAKLKCVAETIVERVPVTVWRKVPCATTTAPEALPVKPMPPPAK